MIDYKKNHRIVLFFRKQISDFCQKLFLTWSAWSRGFFHFFFFQFIDSLNNQEHYKSYQDKIDDIGQKISVEYGNLTLNNTFGISNTVFYDPLKVFEVRFKDHPD